MSHQMLWATVLVVCVMWMVGGVREVETAEDIAPTLPEDDNDDVVSFAYEWGLPPPPPLGGQRPAAPPGLAGLYQAASVSEPMTQPDVQAPLVPHDDVCSRKCDVALTIFKNRLSWGLSSSLDKDKISLCKGAAEECQSVCQRMVEVLGQCPYFVNNECSIKSKSGGDAGDPRTYKNFKPCPWAIIATRCLHLPYIYCLYDQVD